jgi:hypothetical protein
MPKPFFQRLKDYYESVGAVLRGEADAASIFPNTTDIGMSREKIYAEFLKNHVPSKCNVFFGGFVFGNDGSESGQLDIIVTTDTAPRFDFHNRSGDGKSFSPVEGTLAVVSIKSTLNKAQLEDSLKGIAAIPPTRPLGNRANPMIRIEGYEDWPYKVVYASNGIALHTLMDHLNEFYRLHPNIPVTRRPNIIHVAGLYVIFRLAEPMTVWDKNIGKEISTEAGTYYPFVTDPDLQAYIPQVAQMADNKAGHG